MAGGSTPPSTCASASGARWATGRPTRWRCWSSTPCQRTTRARCRRRRLGCEQRLFLRTLPQGQGRCWHAFPACLTVCFLRRSAQLQRRCDDDLTLPGREQLTNKLKVDSWTKSKFENDSWKSEREGEDEGKDGAAARSCASHPLSRPAQPRPPGAGNLAQPPSVAPIAPQHSRASTEHQQKRQASRRGCRRSGRAEATGCPGRPRCRAPRGASTARALRRAAHRWQAHRCSARSLTSAAPCPGLWRHQAATAMRG